MIAESLAAGGRLGRYSLVAPVPTGDGHDLWLAKPVAPTSPDAAVLLRVVPEEIARDGARLEAALAEATVAAACEHPHLARLIEIGEDGGRYYLVSEYVSGRTVRQIQHRAGSLNRIPPIWFTLHVARVVSDGLSCLHRRCAEHGVPLRALRQTVSPDNVVVSFAGDTKLCAFGLGLPNAVPTASASGPLNRTFAYVAPERIAATPATLSDVARADVYSVGVLLYEALTGRRPFETTDEENLLREVLDERRDPIPPSIVAPWVTQPLEEIVITAIARDPGLRFGSAEQLRDALSDYMAWAGLRPERRHVAQQVCGVVAHADSEPPPSARSEPTGRPYASRVPPPRRSDKTASNEDPAARAPANAQLVAERPSDPGLAWDLAAAAARRATARPPAAGATRPVAHAGPPRADDAAELTRAPSAVPPGERHFWDEVVRQRRSTATDGDDPTAAAIEAFESGLELARKGDFAAALVELEQALRLDPTNRVCGANLRRVQRELERRGDPTWSATEREPPPGGAPSPPPTVTVARRC